MTISTTQATRLLIVFFAHLAFFAVNNFLFPSSSARALDNIRVASASLTSPSILYLQVAQKEGYFKQEGLNVEILNIRGGRRLY